jgi:iron-regulated transporter 1
LQSSRWNNVAITITNTGTVNGVHDGKFWLMVVLVIISGTISYLGSTATTLAVEKDWVKVITEGNSSMLAHTNSMMRRLDLTCKVAAPIVVGT